MPEVDLVKGRALAAACVEKLTLPLSSRVWRGQAGEFAGAGVGSSIDFHDQRSYMPGDDPRHINWQAFARTGTYTMKLYREEVRPVVDLLLDCSKSMFFDEKKAQRTAEVFLTVALSALQAGASLRMQLVGASEVKPMSVEMLQSGLWWEIVEALSEKEVGEQAARPAVERAQLRSNAIRVWVSDCLYAGEPGPMIRKLSGQQGSLIILSPYCRAESDPDWAGNYEFVDVEAGSEHSHTMDVRALEAYHEAYVNHFKIWQESSRRYQASFARVDSENDLLRALMAEAVAVGGMQLK